MWEIFLSNVVLLVIKGTLTQLQRNVWHNFFSNSCQKMRGGKHVKVKKRRCQDILRFCAARAKTDFRVHIGTPLDHLSVKKSLSRLVKRPFWSSCDAVRQLIVCQAFRLVCVK